MDILYVGTLPPHRGGSAIQAAHVVVGLARLGHRVRAIAQIAATAGAEDGFASRHPELEIVRMTVPHFHIDPALAPDESFRELEGRQLEELTAPQVARDRPDALLVGRESFAWHLPRLASTNGLPRVLLAQGATAAIADGLYPREYAEELVRRIRQVDRVVTASRHLERALRELGVEPVDVVPNAVDLLLFRPAPRDARLAAELGIVEDDVVVLHASNLKPLKRPLDLVESAAIALADEPRLLYVVVGDGPLRQSTEALAVARGLAERFRFVPWVEHERMPPYLNLADVVAMPSEFESQALVYLEAMACGRVLLASDIPGARGVAVDGETAVFFPRGDVGELAAQTVRLARDPVLREAIGQRARERIGRHSVDRVAREYERILLAAVATAG